MKSSSRLASPRLASPRPSLPLAISFVFGGRRIPRKGFASLVSAAAFDGGGASSRLYNQSQGDPRLLDIGNNDIGSQGAFHIAEYIRNTKHLMWLNLYMNDIYIGDELELSYNPIGAEGVKAPCEDLKFHGKIETLMLSWCQIGAYGAQYTADCLKYNTTILTLDLRANGLGDEGAIFLAQSLKVVNDALAHLDLGFNEIRIKVHSPWQKHSRPMKILRSVP